MNLEDVAQFFKDFADAEIAADIAARTHPDLNVVESTSQATRRFFGGQHFGAQIFFRGANPPAQTEAAALKMFAPRMLRSVTELKLGNGGLIYRATMTSTISGDREPTVRFYARELSEVGLRIIAQYHACNSCDGVGKDGRHTCAACEGSGFRFRGGEQLTEFGGEVRSFGTQV